VTAIALHLVPNTPGNWQMGTLASPVLPHLADTPEQTLSYSGPQVTTGGVLCGRCTDERAEAGDPMRVCHASVARVRACDDAYHASMAEGAAEARNSYL
jgi:hypothetical protein